MAKLTGRRIVVAGAGAIGLTCAVEAARAGAAVMVVDPGGAGASAIAAGMLAPVFETAFEDDAADRFALFIDARDRWPAWAAAIGLNLDRAGAMAVGDEAQVGHWVDRLAALGIAAPALPPRAVQARSPGVRDGWWGVFAEGDWRLEPQAALAALRATLAVHGGEVVAGAVEGFDAGEARLAGGERLRGDELIVATGAATALAALAPELTMLAPIKGHILTAPRVEVAGPVVRYAGGYVCPGAAGAVIGATMEAGRADSAVDPAAAAALLATAAEAMPRLGGARTIARAGVRAATPDGLPLVGPSVTQHVWIAAGARRNGWLLAPLIAEALVAALAGERAPEAFSPARFG